MKKLFSLVLLTLISCQKDINTATPQVAPQENCRVTSISVTGINTNPYKIIYSYDSKGLISCMEINENGYIGRTYFKRDANGKLISSVLISGNSPSDSSMERFTYTSDRITHVDYGPSLGGQIDIAYYPSGLISEIHKTFGASHKVELFEYNSEGILVKRTSKEYAVDVPYFFVHYEVTTPQGVPVKSSEKYLVDHGLPDFYRFGTFSFIIPGEQSSIDHYYVEDAGASIFTGTWTYKTVTTNSRGFTEKIELADSTGKVVQTITYGFENCN